MVIVTQDGKYCTECKKWFGWFETHDPAQHRVQRIGLLARLKKLFGAIANR